MLMRTHLAIAFFAALFLLNNVTYKFTFIVVTLIATMLPDIDSAFSTIGKHKIARPIQMLTKHRGFVHSFTLCLGLSILFALYLPVLALPFFLGYAMHLLADSFTVEGIRPFWPFRSVSKGMLRVGGSIEQAIFIGFCIVDLVLFVSLFLK
ncbi:MAG: metal-dependent hydrolase [Nanoarchaeota archaeon]